MEVIRPPIPGLRGPHLQTVVASLLPPPPAPSPERIEWVGVGGAELRLRIHQPRPEPVGTLLLVHGLGGSSEAGYVRRTASAAAAAGWTTARLDLRGCGGTVARSRSLHNAAQSADVGHVLAHLAAGGAARPIVSIGFSLGANLVLHEAARAGDGSAADAVVALHPPVDVAACAAAVDWPSNAIYRRYFLRLLCRHLRGAREVLGLDGLPMRPADYAGLQDFDERVTAPLGGYTSAAEYYRAASTTPLAGGIRRPALVVSARDDPFVPIGIFDEFRRRAPACVRLVHPGWGGHIGYFRPSRRGLTALAGFIIDRLDGLVSAGRG